MQWSEWLKQHKRAANNDCLLFLSRKHNYQSLCLGWRNTRITFPADETMPDVPDAFAEAWKICHYNLMELSDKSGILKTQGIAAMVENAAYLGMIYPDGTLNESASKLLSAIIAKEVKNAAKQPTA